MKDRRANGLALLTSNSQRVELLTGSSSAQYDRLRPHSTISSCTGECETRRGIAASLVRVVNHFVKSFR